METGRWFTGGPSGACLAQPLVQVAGGVGGAVIAISRPVVYCCLSPRSNTVFQSCGQTRRLSTFTEFIKRVLSRMHVLPLLSQS